MSVAKMGKASGKMQSAEGALGQQKPGDAVKEQKEAVDALEDAKGELQHAMNELKKDLEEQVRSHVIAALTEMLKEQQAVRTSTEQLGPEAGKGNTRALFGIKRLAKAEDRITENARSTAALVEETEFSVALPAILGSIERRTIYISTDLKSGNGDEQVVSSEKKVEKDLADLLEAMEDAAGRAGESSSDSCSSCGGESNRNRILSELKILRLLQVRVNEETMDVDGRRARLKEKMSPELQKTIGSVREHQDDVMKATLKLHDISCKNCAGH
ncbi:MAG: hypothetical protein AAF492_15730 [Verrucomicrobiota bacterium]